MVPLKQSLDCGMTQRECRVEYSVLSLLVVFRATGNAEDNMPSNRHDAL